MILQNRDLLKAYGRLLRALGNRVEFALGIQAATIKIIAARVDSHSDCAELLMGVARMESDSDALSCQIEQFMKALDADDELRPRPALPANGGGL